MLNYIIEVQIAWLFLWGFYAATLNRETYFYVNRWYLLTTVILGLLLPFVKLSQTVQAGLPAAEHFILDTVNIGQGFYNSTSVWSVDAYVIWMIYWTVAGLFLLRFFVGIKGIWRLLSTARVIKYRDYWLVSTEQKVAPFSFFRFLFVPSGHDLSAKELEAVITHESVHISSWHSLDRIFIELCTVFFWFSPLIWLYRRSIIDVHEFEADAKARQSHGLNFYGQLLIDQASKARNRSPIPVGSAIFNNQLTRRFRMMTKKPSNQVSLVKYLLTIPVLLLGLFVISCQDNLQTIQPIESLADQEKVVEVDQAEKEEIFNRVEVMPNFRNGDKDLIMYLGNHIQYPSIARQNEIEGTVVIQFVIDEAGNIIDPEVIRGIGGGCDEEALRVVRSMPRWQPGLQEGVPVKVKFTLPIRFKLE